MADEAGLLVMAELPVAYTQYFLPHKDFLRHELTRVLRAHRNHPSFLSLALGYRPDLRAAPMTVIEPTPRERTGAAA